MTLLLCLSIKIRRILLRTPAILIVCVLTGVSGCQSKNSSTANSNLQTVEAEKGPVRIQVELPKTVRLSDEPALTITVDARQDVDVRLPPFGESLDSFQIVNFREPLPTTLDDRRITQQIYTLEAMDAGMLTIDPVAVTFTDQNGDHVLETEPINLEVTTLLDNESPSLDDLMPAAGPVELRSEPWAWAPWIGGILLLAGIPLYLKFRKGRQRKAIAEIIPPDVIAHRALAELRDSKLHEHDVKEFYVSLTGIVRRYIESTTSVSAPEQTTDEFLRVIASHPDFNDTERTRLSRFLESADLVKYAAHTPNENDIEAGFQRAEEFVVSRASTIPAVATEVDA